MKPRRTRSSWSRWRPPRLVEAWAFCWSTAAVFFALLVQLLPLEGWWLFAVPLVTLVAWLPWIAATLPARRRR